MIACNFWAVVLKSTLVEHLCFFTKQVLTSRKNFQSGGVPCGSLVPVKSVEEAGPSKVQKCC